MNAPLKLWRRALQMDHLDSTLARCAGLDPDEVAPSELKKRMGALLDGFQNAFQASEDQEVWCFSTPGRTELLGNHTDHQQGSVVAGSVNLDVWAVAAEHNEPFIRFQSEGWPLEVLDLSDLQVHPEEFGTTHALLRGIVAGMQMRGAGVRGFDLYCQSDVLPGSGLSSSAAIEVLLSLVCSTLWGQTDLTALDWAQIGQMAENRYFGKPSGLMDQVACAVGTAVSIDFEDPEHPVVESLPFDLERAGYALCILDSGADHADLTDEYAAVPEEMKQVAACLGKNRLREVSEELFYASLKELRAKVSDRALLRAMHFYGEQNRVARAAQALKKHHMKDFLQLVNESGQSSWQYLQNISPSGAVQHQAMALALAVAKHALHGEGACRVHGGGFAGTVQAFVPLKHVKQFAREVEAVLGAGSCQILTVRVEGAFVFPAPRI